MDLRASFYISGNPDAIPVTLEMTAAAPAVFRAAWTNTTGAPVRAEQFLFDGFRFDVPGERIRLYCEGWSAVSAAAGRNRKRRSVRGSTQHGARWRWLQAMIIL